MKGAKRLAVMLVPIALMLLFSCTDSPTNDGRQPPITEEETPMSENRTILERELATTECKDEKMDNLVEGLEKLGIGTIMSVEIQVEKPKSSPNNNNYQIILVDDQEARFTFLVTHQGNVFEVEKQLEGAVWYMDLLPVL
jgi:hypothetical protein